MALGSASFPADKPRTPKPGVRATQRSRGLNGPRDGLYDTLELGDFHLELFSAQGREPVIARPTIARRNAPFCRNPAFNQHAL